MPYDGMAWDYCRETIMKIKTKEMMIARIYLTEAAHELDTVLDYLRGEAGISGFSVFRAIRGMGASGEHVARLVDVSLNLPIIVEFFDEKPKVEEIIEALSPVVRKKHIVFWEVKVNDED